ncbi:MAG TPA: hypothetical protein ENK98_06140 [Epsilonproteobacteria bacterium]|nr:hypothetical protein [Campylobacterota bacterium]HHD79195.1 hypothetical protein [Campylobacterota bacterium]
MSQVIMMFLFPIGLYFYFFVERRDRPKYQKIFDDFGEKTAQDNTLTDVQKIQKYTAMLRQNGYTIVESNQTKVRGEKRILSMSLLAMSIGAYYVGVLVYLAYYFWVQKPHVVEYNI